ncbi:hypothetical protein RFI_30872 [Reticulomyxa filosa]|uniref:Uncharacterized protein n=1 Tax=Reticulomyxa filosa TaxID=46433 RepID=X6LX51_RETFI|nr:hypothetical protein RFI_30872 [Reticulomyxa filosa]|eukprot:ETO06518.1 hypothetical protein RFI_30872 [Reticulomyxa filosa]
MQEEANTFAQKHGEFEMADLQIQQLTKKQVELDLREKAIEERERELEKWYVYITYTFILIFLYKCYYIFGYANTIYRAMELKKEKQLLSDEQLRMEIMKDDLSNPGMRAERLREQNEPFVTPPHKQLMDEQYQAMMLTTIPTPPPTPTPPPMPTPGPTPPTHPKPSRPSPIPTPPTPTPTPPQLNQLPLDSNLFQLSQGTNCPIN